MQVGATLAEKFLESLGLGYGARKTVEHDTAFAGSLFLEHIVENVYHKLIRYELALRDVFVGRLAKRSAAFYVIAQKFTCRNVI